ncbi:hypothetical protein MANES_01G186650v8 [Manihot esculenta]|uniref:Uncharacterized protein n=1 Tax=Manihot esculenta TaxID=3983 RepID=A0ACB7IDP3_MANES|nr:hypothetical protein MANES_01G186650v8 [Manihot esculenta]
MWIKSNCNRFKLPLVSTEIHLSCETLQTRSDQPVQLMNVGFFVRNVDD